MKMLKIKAYRLFRDLRFRRKCSMLFSKYSSYTMIPRSMYISNLEIASEFRNIPGDVVECGVWKGGMIAGIAEVVGGKNYYLFDSFEGLPPANEIDGIDAINWQKNTSGKNYFNNCTAEEQYANEAMSLTGFDFKLIKGWFDETLSFTPFVSNISILRLDADWYGSTLTCLRYLFPKVSKGGVVIIDDYYAWDGCSRAVHFYLNSINSSSRIQSKNGVAFIIKNE